jgi:hypothetical protein
MVFSIETYIQFLDSVIDECGSVADLLPASNAVTRRAKASYMLERDSLVKMASRHNITEFPWEVYDKLWPKLCKREKYGILREDYAKPKETAQDMRWPQDGRVVPGYAKDALAQLRTLTECVVAVREEKANTVKAA